MVFINWQSVGVQSLGETRERGLDSFALQTAYVFAEQRGRGRADSAGFATEGGCPDKVVFHLQGDDDVITA